VRCLLIAGLAVLLLAGCDRGSNATGEMMEVAPRTFNQAQLSMGKRVYDAHCKKCHGASGEGARNWQIQGPDGKYPAPPLNGSGHTWHHTTPVLVSVIKDGSPGGMGNMPGLKDKLSDQEVTAVIEWIKSLWSEEAYLSWYQRELADQGHSH